MNICCFWQAEDVLLKLRDRKKIQAHRELEKIKSSISTEKVYYNGERFLSHLYWSIHDVLLDLPVKVSDLILLLKFNLYVSYISIMYLVRISHQLTIEIENTNDLDIW